MIFLQNFLHIVSHLSSIFYIGAIRNTNFKTSYVISIRNLILFSLHPTKRPAQCLVIIAKMLQVQKNVSRLKSVSQINSVVKLLYENGMATLFQYQRDANKLNHASTTCLIQLIFGRLLNAMMKQTVIQRALAAAITTNVTLLKIVLKQIDQILLVTHYHPLG